MGGALPEGPRKGRLVATLKDRSDATKPKESSSRKGDTRLLPSRPAHAPIQPWQEDGGQPSALACASEHGPVPSGGVGTTAEDPGTPWAPASGQEAWSGTTGSHSPPNTFFRESEFGFVWGVFS